MTIIEIIELLKKHRLKQTEKRAGLLKILRENEREFQLYELVLEMRKTFPCVAQQTIVTNLESFVDAGLIVKNNGENECTFSMAKHKVS